MALIVLIYCCLQAQLEGMKAERDTLDASRKAEAAEARKALAEIDYLQVGIVNSCRSPLSTAPLGSRSLGSLLLH